MQDKTQKKAWSTPVIIFIGSGEVNGGNNNAFHEVSPMSVRFTDPVFGPNTGPATPAVYNDASVS